MSLMPLMCLCLYVCRCVMVQETLDEGSCKFNLCIQTIFISVRGFDLYEGGKENGNLVRLLHIPN